MADDFGVVLGCDFSPNCCEDQKSVVEGGGQMRVYIIFRKE